MADDEVTSEISEEETPVQETDIQVTTSKIVSRGVPSKESLWLDDIRKRRDQWQYHKKVRLDLEQLMQIIFPKQYQPKYYDVALNFMYFLLEKGELKGDDTGKFIKEKSYSKATFYNIILPRLKKVGMVRLSREEFTISSSKQKYYRKVIQPSKQFSIYFKKIGDEFETLLDTAEMKRGNTE